MAAGFNNCQITEANHNLPPELSEIIYKHYLAIKLKEREALGWNLVHNELLIQPFCSEMERHVHIIVCVAYMHCCCGGCCYPCYKQEEILHEITISVPDIIDLTLIKFVLIYGKRTTFPKLCLWRMSSRSGETHRQLKIKEGNIIKMQDCQECVFSHFSVIVHNRDKKYF